MNGIFVSFEGPDGSGKTTQINKLADYLKSKGMDFVVTREPGGTVISEKIRSIILDPENSDMAPVTEAFLYASSRAQHVAQLIKPSLAEGKIVISDRFMDSSIAYQGYARKLGDIVRVINEIAVDGCMPDITFFLDIKPEDGIRRAKGRRALDRLEQEDISFHSAVYDGYKELQKLYEERYIRIDASKSEDEVFEDIIKEFEKYLEHRNKQ